MIKRLVVGVIEQARVVLMILSTVVRCVAVGVGSSSVGGGVRGGGVRGVAVGRVRSGVGHYLGLRLGVGVGESHGQHGEEGELKTKHNLINH